MKSTYTILTYFVVMMTVSISSFAQDNAAKTTDAKSAAADAKSNSELDAKAGQWASSLSLNDAAKEARVKALIVTHLTAVRDWNNSHAYTLVPAGINPTNGKPLSAMDRQIIILSTIPKSVHDDLMAGLRKDLTEEQVELILDKYTIGKVAFTMNGYKSIVPNLTPVEEGVILTNLKLAREQAIDYKNIKQVSAIFEIYKTKIETYFNENGRNWRQMFKAYVDQVKAKKAAAAGANPPPAKQ